MADTCMLEGQEETVCIGGGSIINLHFADDIFGLAGQEQELANLVNHFEVASTAFDIKINAEKTQLMTNNINDSALALP